MSVPGRRRRRFGRDDAGMATAEFAMALPAVVVVLTLVIGVAQLMLTHHRAWHAASVAARVAARGEDDGAVRRAVTAAGLPAAVTVNRDASWVTTTVTTSAPAPLGWALPDIDARVVAAREVSDAPGDSAGSISSAEGRGSATGGRGIGR